MKWGFHTSLYTWESQLLNQELHQVAAGQIRGLQFSLDSVFSHLSLILFHIAQVTARTGTKNKFTDVGNETKLNQWFPSISAHHETQKLRLIHRTDLAISISGRWGWEFVLMKPSRWSCGSWSTRYDFALPQRRSGIQEAATWVGKNHQWTQSPLMPNVTSHLHSCSLPI